MFVYVDVKDCKIGCMIRCIYTGTKFDILHDNMVNFPTNHLINFFPPWKC